MTDLAARLAELWLVQVIQLTVLILLIAVAVRWGCRQRPFLASALWTVVLIKCLLPPIVHSPVGLFCQWGQAPESQPAAVLQVTVGPAADLPAGRVAEQLSIAAQPAGCQEQTRAAVSRATPTRTAGQLLVPAGLGLWAAGTLVMLCLYMLRCGRFLWLVRLKGTAEARGSVMERRVERQVRRLARYLGLRRRPRVMVSEQNVGPAVFGLWRPTIIVPRTLVASLSAKQLTPILLHELIHLRRGDLWLALGSLVTRSLWWFHPLVWWALRQGELEVERCCDESVVACMPRRPARYAHSLLNTLEQSHRLQTIVLVPGVRPADITANRLERIMKLGQGSRKRMPISSWVLILLVAAVVLPGAAGTFAQSPGADVGRSDVQQLPALPLAARVKELAQPAQPTATKAGEPYGVVDPRVAPASHVASDSGPWAELAAADAAKKQAADDVGPVVVKVYEVADLLDKLREDEAWPENTSRGQLRLSLAAHLQICDQSNLVPPSLADMGTKPAPPGPRARLVWNNDQLVVSAPTSTHDRIAKEIEQRREYSFRQVSVEVRMLQGAAPWAEPQDEATAREFHDRWQLLPQDFLNVEPTGERARNGNLLPENLRVEQPDRPTVHFSSGRRDPIVFQLADDEQFRSFMQAFSHDGLNRIKQAPKVTLFDGQQAEISDVSQQPFVTDVKRIEGDGGEAFQPVIRVFWEGTRIQLQPVITEAGHRLVCRFRFASIDGSKNFKSPRFPEASGLMVQHPIVTTSDLECAMDIPAGQTLVIGGLFPQTVQRKAKQSTVSRWLGRQQDTQRVEQVMYMAITPRTIPPVEGDIVESVPPHELPALLPALPPGHGM